MTDLQTDQLRVVIANERQERLTLVAASVVALGHVVVAREVDPADAAAATAAMRPDVAIVGLGASTEHALRLIERIVREATCPVIVLMHAPDPAFLREASKRGVFAFVGEDDDWQSTIDMTLRRFADYRELEHAFGRRAVTERAKGILMERHSIDETAAFELLRTEARSTNRKLADVAAAVASTHALLPKQPASV